jgi:hypothetical protein
MAVTVSEIYDLMRMRFLASRLKRKTFATDLVQFCGFQPEDVALVHSPKNGTAGQDMRFSLKDGRVVDMQGKPCTPDPALYQVEAVAP